MYKRAMIGSTMILARNLGFVKVRCLLRSTSKGF